MFYFLSSFKTPMNKKPRNEVSTFVLYKGLASLWGLHDWAVISPLLPSTPHLTTGRKTRLRETQVLNNANGMKIRFIDTHHTYHYLKQPGRNISVRKDKQSRCSLWHAKIARSPRWEAIRRSNCRLIYILSIGHKFPCLF